MQQNTSGLQYQRRFTNLDTHVHTVFHLDFDRFYQ